VTITSLRLELSDTARRPTWKGSTQINYDKDILAKLCSNGLRNNHTMGMYCYMADQLYQGHSITKHHKQELLSDI
jgi:hypothetical protein